jgi:hypothetical protein
LAFITIFPVDVTVMGSSVTPGDVSVALKLDEEGVNITKLGNVGPRSTCVLFGGETVLVVVNNMKEVMIVTRGGSEEEVRLLVSAEVEDGVVVV